jgi:hypothetical protein
MLVPSCGGLLEFFVVIAIPMKPIFERTLIFLSYFMLTVCSVSNAAQAPDWAEKMMGRWSGEGARVELQSGNQTLVEVQVSSEWVLQGARSALVSRNRFKETELDVDGNPGRTKEYDRVYWIQEKLRQGSRVELVLGSGSDPAGSVESTGVYDGLNESMTVQQNVSPALKVFTQTDLSHVGLTLYRETVWVNGKKKTSSEIRFQRLR